jgi:omega-6 fatty acid desaturase (delta-12 desaturase)
MTGIPNYNLPKCHEGIAIMKAIKPTSVLTSLKSLTYRLWDEDSRQLVGFKKVKEYRLRHTVAA